MRMVIKSPAYSLRRGVIGVKKRARDNVGDMHWAIVGNWVRNLEPKELFVFWYGRIGMGLSDDVHIEWEDVDALGGIDALAEILQSMETKAELLKYYRADYHDVLKTIKRVRGKFDIEGGRKCVSVSPSSPSESISPKRSGTTERIPSP